MPEEKKSETNVAPLIDAKALGEILAAVENRSAANTEKLVAALLAGPQPDPKAAANAEIIRKSDEAVRERERRNIENAQKFCKHLQGSHALSEIPGQLTSIVKHRLDTGEIMGICTNCDRKWRVGDPDYNEWMTRKSGNRMSEAGTRYNYASA